MKLFKIYNKLTDNANKEYKFLAQCKSNHLDKAREIIAFLEEQDIDLYRMPDYDNSDEVVFIFLTKKRQFSTEWE